MKQVYVIGAGLAGCEASLQLANHGVKVVLYEQKPYNFSPAHKSENFCELVCSNTFKSVSTEFATGLLKEELKLLKSPVLDCAYNCRVPAGDALAVDREIFSKMVTDLVNHNPNIEVVKKEIDKIPLDKPVIIATGPLTSEKLSKDIQSLLGDGFNFYDALAPIVYANSIDMSKTFTANRWGKDDGDYINCPLNKEEYLEFLNQLKNAERVKLKDFENEKNFEGCLPVEIMAKRGEDVLRFGPMKAIGFDFDGKKPYAVVQLRKENIEGDMYNMVGFQTNLTYREQKRVFSLIPALKNAEYARLGAMHRNSYINAPKFLTSRFNLKSHPNVFFAGQISGVEGYLESIASGCLCAIYMLQYLNNKNLTFSSKTALGALGNYLSCASEVNFQPMHITWGLISPINAPKQSKRQMLVERALNEVNELKELLWT